jgi:UDP-glucose 4-epimerase
MVITITGATGFLGNALLRRLSSQYEVVALVRKEPLKQLAGLEYRICGDLSPTQEWSNQLLGVDVVIHTAARVHVMQERSASEREYRRTNVEGTLNLARQAANAGAKRFIFLSSIKVNGEFTNLGKPFQASDVPKPEDTYGVSKMEAELGLYEISKDTSMEVVCIRPPLVYGPGVKGNFLSLLRWLERGLPLPLGSVHNLRSLVALDNLVDLIITCLDHPAAANQSFLVSDNEDLSTTELLRRMGNALDRPARLIPVPPRLLQWGAKLFGKEEIAQRLLANLQVDISKTKERLGWAPPLSVDEGLRKTAEWYLKQ